MVAIRSNDKMEISDIIGCEIVAATVMLAMV